MLVIFCVIFVAFVIYLIGYIRFTKRYADLAARLDSHFGNRPDSALSPGHTYAVASRGPGHAREAELQSAEARWRHLSMAFPHLDDRGHERRDIILVSREYTNIRQVNDMQKWLRSKIKGHLSNRDRVVLEPTWIQGLGEDFDALRHPQLAIANPAVYTFPFFLTWQRRHQWGVLPYAVHTRLGVICCNDHPKHSVLREIENAYSEDLDSARADEDAFWVNDPKHARWLSILLESSGSTPIDIDRSANALPIAEQHTSATIFSVGAYLHKEILPLLCTVVPNVHLGGKYAQYARELEVTDLTAGGLLSDISKWQKNSAVIADLAVLPANLEQQGWAVFRLPHCVYVPIGVGYSVAAVPIFLQDRTWTDDLLEEVGEFLTPATDDLAQLGIELEKRFWMAGRNGTS